MKLGDMVEYLTGRLVLKQRREEGKKDLVPEVKVGTIWRALPKPPVSGAIMHYLVQPAGMRYTISVPADKIIPLKDQDCRGMQAAWKYVGYLDFQKVPA